MMTPYSAAFWAWRIMSADFSSAFDGMQPQLRQMPPARSRSTHRSSAQLRGADRGDVAAGAGADDDEIVLVSHRPERQRIGFSMIATIAWSSFAPSAPSMTRWSQDT